MATLLEHFTEPHWRAALEAEVAKPYFAELARFVTAERAKKTIFPPERDVFSAFNFTPLPDVRVVILGQDPYHGAGQAHGLCFSVGRGVQVPPSLKNIYTELEADIPGFKRPMHGNLEGWAKRGVLMVNATLTVRKGEANSHEKFGWQTFTDAVVRVLSARAEPIVFILWGGFAQRKGKVINRQRHFVIEAAHPSPLSVTKFRGCKVFSKVSDARASASWQHSCRAAHSLKVCVHDALLTRALAHHACARAGQRLPDAAGPRADRLVRPELTAWLCETVPQSRGR